VEDDSDAEVADSARDPSTRNAFGFDHTGQTTRDASVLGTRDDSTRDNSTRDNSSRVAATRDRRDDLTRDARPDDSTRGPSTRDAVTQDSVDQRAAISQLDARASIDLQNESPNALSKKEAGTALTTPVKTRVTSGGGYEPARYAGATRAASDRRGDNSKRIKDLYLKAKAEFGLDCRICAIFA